MGRYKLVYMGITSEFNTTQIGCGGTVQNGKYITYFRKYSVRPSKTNKLKISQLIESFNEDGTVTYNFYTRNPRGFIKRGLEVICEKVA